MIKKLWLWFKSWLLLYKGKKESIIFVRFYFVGDVFGWCMIVMDDFSLEVFRFIIGRSFILIGNEIYCGSCSWIVIIGFGNFYKFIVCSLFYKKEKKISIYIVYIKK